MHSKYTFSRYVEAAAILILPLLLAYLVYGYSEDKYAVIDEGGANLGTVNLDYEPVVLQGTWEYYPNQLLTQEDMDKYQSERRLVEFPGDAIGADNFCEHPGTYRLKVECGRVYSSLALYTANLPNRARLFINSREIKVAPHNRFDAMSLSRSTVFEFWPHNKSNFDIIIQSLDGNNYSGGFSTPLFIGTSNVIFAQRSTNTAAKGILIVFGVSSLLIFAGSFFQRNRERALLWLAVFIGCHTAMWAINYFNVTRMMDFLTANNSYKLALAWIVVNLLYLSRFVGLSQKYRGIIAFRYLTCSAIGIVVLLIALPLLLAEELFVTTVMIELGYIIYLLRLSVAMRAFGWRHVCFGTSCVMVLLFAETGWLLDMGVFTIMACMAMLLFVVIQLLYVTELHKLNYECERHRALQLAYYRLQIKPHFIYNILSSIASMIVNDPKKAFTSLIQFSAYIRQLLENNPDQDQSSLGDEIELVKRYLILESIRYQEKLSFDIIVHGDVEGFGIPPFSLQTIVENCIKHGTLKDGVADFVLIAINIHGARCMIEVSNTIAGFDEYKLQQSLSGASRGGLFNVKSRIEACNSTLTWSVRDNRISFVLDLRR